ncbi:orotate phosphoribosyltransferase [Sutterella sp.]|uniref:orotate phosphoribosyltransferase n=1 Tax=Sutterella sp. TaxID=1981025 RepID=UPI0026DFB55A|nr:phosphoribosyltransferase family protein [Sutterella sp.]MDO5531199.1 phosphoribosyltransferase family protein [Sutterella sp.]
MYVSPIANDILAGHLVKYGAVSFLTDDPMRLKSGLVTPIYVDNRSLTGHPDAWRDIIETTCSRISQLGLEFDIIAGVEGAGVSHAAALAYRLGKPHVFVRQRAKTYGDHSRVEGTSVKGKRVLIIEDHISTGLSLLSAVEGLKEEGAIVENCLAITSFGIDETSKLFKKENVVCHELLDFTLVLDKAIELGKLEASKKETLIDWLANPWTWAARHGLTPTGNEN